MPNDVIKHVEVNGTTYDIVDAVSGYIKSSDIPVTDVKVNNTSIVSSGVANLVTNTAYNSSSNKLATMSDLPSVTSSYSSTGTTAVNGTAVNAALQTLDSSISATTGEAISAITITDGKITSSTKISVGDANQNAFSNVKVGNDTVAADSTTDTLELVAGTGITLTADTTNDKITITSTVSGGVTDVQVNNSSILDSSGVANFTSTTITDALGYTPYNSTNPNGYITGGTNSSSNVTINTTTDTIYKVTSSGSVSNGSAASFTQGTDSYTAPILTFTPNSGTTGNLGISWTTGSFTQGTDSFTANTPTSVTLPTVSSTPTTVLTGITSAVAGAQTFTGTNNIQSAGANEF